MEGTNKCSNRQNSITEVLHNLSNYYTDQINSKTVEPEQDCWSRDAFASEIKETHSHEAQKNSSGDESWIPHGKGDDEFMLFYDILVHAITVKYSSIAN